MRMLDKLTEWRDKKYSRVPLVLFCPKFLVGYYKNHNFTEFANDVFYLQKGHYQKSKFAFMTDKPMDDKGRISIPSNPW